MDPYLRIAQHLRRRIERGELAPGARIPSTRALAKKWNVALATAAHALRKLTEEGLIRAEERVGTIVTSPRLREAAQRERAQRSGELTQAAIIAAAIAIADEQGLAALSLRAVASKVGVPVMSLYGHVENKAALVRSMTDAALSDEKLPRERPAGWRAQIEVAVRAEWRVFRKHPWLARVMNLTRPEPLPNAIAYADWIFQALDSTGIDPNAAMRIHVILHGYTQGIAVNVELEADAAGETGIDDDEWMKRREHAFAALADSGRYPAFAKIFRGLDDFDIDFDDLFERGLSTLLDGFAPMMQPRKKRRRGTKKVVV